jgi:hypothetical protein
MVNASIEPFTRSRASRRNVDSASGVREQAATDWRRQILASRRCQFKSVLDQIGWWLRDRLVDRMRLIIHSKHLEKKR